MTPNKPPIFHQNLTPHPSSKTPLNSQHTHFPFILQFSFDANPLLLERERETRPREGGEWGFEKGGPSGIEREEEGWEWEEVVAAVYVVVTRWCRYQVRGGAAVRVVVHGAAGPWRRSTCMCLRTTAPAFILHFMRFLTSRVKGSFCNQICVIVVLMDSNTTTYNFLVGKFLCGVNLTHMQQC